ncbi:Endonuclease III [uncultured archaeon]|nr:Endonuclease III [uncultured archaeon]
MDSSKAIKQLNFLRKLISKNSEKPRLAAEGWDENWKTLIAIILSAQTRDSKTIPVAEKLFDKYNSPEKLGKAPLKEIEESIRSLNYYKTKSKNIKATAEIIGKKGVPVEFEKLIELPGVGRKTANVFLVEEKNAPAIGVDTHVSRLAIKLNWTNKKFEDKFGIEKDLERLFPKKYWNSINYILVTFGQTFGRSKKIEDEIIEKIRNI